MSDFEYRLHQLTDIKIFVIGTITFPFVSFLNLTDAKGYLQFLVFLVFIDLVVGTAEAKSNGEFISSTGVKKTLTKLASYWFVLVCSKFFDDTFGTNSFTLLGIKFTLFELLSFFMILIEMKSILEHFEFLAKGNDNTIIVIFAKIVKKVLDIVKNALEKENLDK